MKNEISSRSTRLILHPWIFDLVDATNPQSSKRWGVVVSHRYP